MLLNSVNPVDNFSYIQLSNNIYKVILRTDIIKHNTHYSFNEYYVVTEISDEDINSNIENNFDKYLEIAKLNDEERKKENLINSYRKELENSDYKIIKTLENYSLGLTLPYDYSSLISSRQELRDQINNLESLDDTSSNELEQCKSRKIIEMCSLCQTTITSGIDYNNEHYRLNTTDQINLTSLYSLAQLGQSVPYHADGKVCRIYTSEEMIRLVQTATKWVIYHTTYYNLLKHQIQDMTDIEEVKKVEYGTELSSEYQTILNTILTQ